MNAQYIPVRFGHDAENMSEVHVLDSAIGYSSRRLMFACHLPGGNPIDVFLQSIEQQHDRGC